VGIFKAPPPGAAPLGRESAACVQQKKNRKKNVGEKMYKGNHGWKCETRHPESSFDIRVELALVDLEDLLENSSNSEKNRIYAGYGEKRGVNRSEKKEPVF